MILIVSLFGRIVILRFYGERKRVIVKDKPFLVSFDQFLKKVRKQWQDIDGVVVVFGEASFSITRQVITVLNTLIFITRLLKIVSIEAKVGDEGGAIRRGIQLLKQMKSPRLIKPFYSRAPNITKQKQT